MLEPNCVVGLSAPELSIKSQLVRSFMQKRLKKNIIFYLKHFEVDYKAPVFFAGRFVIETKEPQKVLDALKKCFGVYSLFLSQKVSFTSLPELCSKGVSICKGAFDSGTFAVRGKSFCPKFKSRELEGELGAEMLTAYPKLKVKLKGSEKELFCVATKEEAFFYFEQIKTAGGMPLGSQGKAGLLVDNYKKEDIVKLALLLMKTGCGVTLVGNKEIELKELEEWNCFEKVNCIPFALAKEYYADEGLRAFFSPAKTLKEAKEDSALVGVKVFAPFLF